MTLTRWPALLVLALLTAVNAPLSAADDKAPAQLPDPVLPKPAEVQALAVKPDKVALKGIDDANQLIVTATVSGKLVDLTHDIKYEVADEKVARVTTTGRVIPLTNGATTVTATYGDKSVKIEVKTESCDVDLPINFGNAIVPIFTKLGCNGGGCHGKASGQGGFRMSLLGFEPDVDFTSLVMEARGRRLFPASPEASLLLTKASGQIAHGGGKRMDSTSDEYRLIRRWIAAGMPFGEKDDPIVTRISVYPEHRVLSRNSRQQFAVYAHYSDNTVEDITRRAQYESNDQEIAIVTEGGLVSTLAMAGEAAIMVRYQEHVSTFRATVPLGVKVPEYTFEPATVVDKHTHKKWQELGLVPSELCSDAEFIRRVSLDLTGTLPTPKQVTDFVADKDAKKRDKLVDTLLESSEYSYFFANKWADILRVKRRNQPNRAQGTFAFHAWIRKAIQKDKPYDEFARDILGATGDEQTSPPVVWYKELTTPEAFVDDAAQVFLGLRLACAQCHHHPYEKWSQDDYWGLAAFFGRIDRKNIPVIGSQQQQGSRLAIFARTSGSVTNKKTGQPAEFKPLDGKPITIDRYEDPRQKLVDWLVANENPFFARAVANRYWAHFFNKGIVDPLDDMRVTNPPSNPELLDALAKDLADNKYSLKHLIRTIVKSRTYQLSSTPNEFNKHDKQNYARYYPRRMSAEVLYDAVNQVSLSPAQFGNLPQDKHAPNRAIMLPDESFPSYFLDVFGRPQRISACECERVSEANLAQALHLLNSDEVQGKLARANGRADLLARDTAKPDAEKVDELFLWAFGRLPTEEQRKEALAHINKHSASKKIAYEDILWALLNTKEFVFNK